MPVAEAAPANDDFEDAIPIRVGQTIKGTINGASVQRAEAPYFSTSPDSHLRSVWYRARANRNVVGGPTSAAG